MTDRPPRSEVFTLALVLALIHALLLSTLLVLAWRTNAVMLLRKDQPTPPVSQAKEM